MEHWTYQTTNHFTYLMSYTDCPTGSYTSGKTTNYQYSTNIVSSSLPQLIQKITYPDGNYDSFTYDSALASTQAVVAALTHRRPNGGTETYGFNQIGIMTSLTDAVNKTTHYIYNPDNRLYNVTDANGVLTAYQCGDQPNNGSYRTESFQDLTSVATVDNKFGQVVTARDVTGNVTAYTYDEIGRLASITGPVGTGCVSHTITYTYNFANNSSSPDIVACSNGITKTTNNEMLWGFKPRSVTTTNTSSGAADPSEVYMSYDAMGNLTIFTDPKGNVTTTQYDARDRKDQVQDAELNITTFVYDDNDNLLTETTPTAVVQNTYDVMNRLYTCAIWNSTQTTEYQSTSYLYDAEGQLQHYFDPDNAEYNYTYDADERLLSMSYPDSSSETYTYDGVGNVLTFTTRDGRVKTTTYNSYSAPTSIVWTGGTGAATPAINITYDAWRRVSAIKNSNCTVGCAYDANNRLNTQTETIAGWSSSAVAPVKYTYRTVDDKLDTLRYPDQTLLTYAYQGRGQLKSITQGTATTPLVSYVFDSANLTSKTLSNGVATSYLYDAMDRLTNVSDVVGTTTLQSFIYGYDAVGRVNYVKRSNNLGDVYSYDPSDQLTTVKYGATNPDTANPTSPFRTVSYTLDLAGNRTQLTDSLAGSTNYTLNANKTNEYTHVGSGNVAYNSAGCLSSDAGSGWTYTYDALDELTQAINSNGAEVDYRYDGLCRCIASAAKAAGGTSFLTTYYIYGLGWNVAEEFTSPGQFPASPTLTETQRYVQGGMTDEIITKTNVTANSTLFYNYDGAGNVTKLTNSSGAIVEQYSYDIYGAPTIQGASGNTLMSSQYGNRYLFCGREYDFVANLYHYRNRDYSPNFGRFFEPDPEGHAGDGANLYRFCNNDPVGTGDPFGEDPPAQQISASEYDEVYGIDQGLQLNTGVENRADLDPADGQGLPNANVSPNTPTSTPPNAPASPPASTPPAQNSPSPQKDPAPPKSQAGPLPVMRPPSYANTDNRQALTTAAHTGMSALDGVQALLNGVGLIPGLNVPANLASAGLSLYQGDYFGAALSIVGVIPFASDFTDSIKLARLGAKWACFSAGTDISTPSGEKPIEQIREGDSVYVYDLAEQKVIISHVSEVFRSTTNVWYDVTIQGDDTVRCTPNHPFWVPSQNAWIQALQLKPGMAVLLEDGRESTVISSIPHLLRRAELTYNFSVEGAHDYFVGKAQILVHNMCAAASAAEGVGFAAKGASSFIVDSNLSVKVAEGLRNAGHDAIHVSELFGKKDPGDAAIANAARQLNARVLTSNIKDFPYIGIAIRAGGSASQQLAHALYKISQL